MKIKVILQTEKLYQKIKKAIENLIRFESESLHDVDIGKWNYRQDGKIK